MHFRVNCCKSPRSCKIATVKHWRLDKFFRKSLFLSLMCHVKRKNSYVIYRSIVLYCFVSSFLRLYIRVFDYLLEIIKEDVFGRLQFLDFARTAIWWYPWEILITMFNYLHGIRKLGRKRTGTEVLLIFARKVLGRVYDDGNVNGTGRPSSRRG